LDSKRKVVGERWKRTKETTKVTNGKERGMLVHDEDTTMAEWGMRQEVELIVVRVVRVRAELKYGNVM
jgi:hypothetical protein